MEKLNVKMTKETLICLERADQLYMEIFVSRWWCNSELINIAQYQLVSAQH